TALTAEWDIPLISALYTKVANAPLTTVDLAALVVAIPATTLSKLVYQRSPFPDDAAVAAFKTSFTAATVTQHLSHATAAPTSAAGPVVATAEPTQAPRTVPPDASIFFRMVALVNRGVFIYTDTALDIDPEADEKPWLNTLALVQEWV